MASEKLLNDGKRELADSLKALEKASRQWRRSLMVELDGDGLFHGDTCHVRESGFDRCLESVEEKRVS